MERKKELWTVLDAFWTSSNMTSVQDLKDKTLKFFKRNIKTKNKMLINNKII